MTGQVIVNADDFGLTAGVNRAVAEAHTHGVLTSASLMVLEPGAEEAARLAAALPGLSVGLHVTAPAAGSGWPQELEHQIARFRELVGADPTHLDSHHNAHRDPNALPHFVRAARTLRIPLREHSAARYFSRFYGSWGGETHPEQISVDSLLRMLDQEARSGCTEVATHPGYVDAELRSSYACEREIELRTLCDPRLRDAIEARPIELIGFAQLAGSTP
jgi:chitin disaccharide deacetylase